MKKIISFDENTFAGELAYGYSNKKEAIKAIEEQTGEKVEHPEDMEKLKVVKVVDKEKGDLYTWSDTCDSCKQKIKGGVTSWASFS